MPKAVKVGNQVIDPENPGIDRPVVIKEFTLDDPGAERAIEMLSYGFSCVPKLYHVEKSADAVKIYQEFIEGTHLYDLNPGTLVEVVVCAREIARALRLVHKQAEAVRDVTPDNIIFRDGLAYFVDLSTTDTEYTPGFKPPEVDGSLTGGYCRASDIYQFGIILRSLLQAAGLKDKTITALTEQCLLEDPNQRPTAEDLCQRVEHLERQISRPRERYLHWLLLVFVLVLVIFIADAIMVPNSTSLKVNSLEDVRKIREKLALQVDSQENYEFKHQAAREISKFLKEETALTTELIDAVFLTKNLLILSEGKALGLGSRVRLRSGLKGYIVGADFEGVHVITDQGRVNFDLNYRNIRGGFSRHYWMSVAPLSKNIFIREKHRNLNMLVKGVAQHLGLRIDGEIKGATAGLFEAEDIQSFFQTHQEQLEIHIEGDRIYQRAQNTPLYFPVAGVWLTPKCEYLEIYLGAKVEGCEWLKDRQPLISYANTLDNLLLVYQLRLEDTDQGYRLVQNPLPSLD